MSPDLHIAMNLYGSFILFLSLESARAITEYLVERNAAWDEAYETDKSATRTIDASQLLLRAGTARG